jgi:hypothetical protein
VLVRVPVLSGADDGDALQDFNGRKNWMIAFCLAMFETAQSVES